MSSQTVYLGATEAPSPPPPPTMEAVDLPSGRYLLLRDVDGIAPFFMNIVGASDMWLFTGSNGRFTAGRIEPDCAIFPYETVDKILSAGRPRGALTILLVERMGRTYLWEPWNDAARHYGVQRDLSKHVLGCEVVFRETNQDLGLRFQWSLSTCAEYGLIRECSIENLSSDDVRVRYLDGWIHMIAPGVTQETYARLSYLAAGYMRHERVSCDLSPLGVYTLNAAIADRPEPVESLRCGAAWSIGHPDPTVLLSDRQVHAFRCGGAPSDETEVRGEFGALLVESRVELHAGATHRWLSGADTRLDPAAVLDLRTALGRPDDFSAAVTAAREEDREALRRIIGSADGLQFSADAAASAHHTANVVYNCMRGGAIEDGGRFETADLASFIRERNRATASAHVGWLAGLPQTLSLRDTAEGSEGPCSTMPEDPHLRRLVREYLPLTFSRRHGDPSRPWNHFSIRVKDAWGKRVTTYQGNWRDIFQNWESLAHSFPDAIGGMVATFLSASTADGYNPYRITRDGVDWEVAAPGDVWGHYGYWGDHQIVYLLRLLEAMDRFQPAALAAAFREPRYTYAHVPYKIAGLDAMLADPRRTIVFDHELHQHLLSRAAAIGGDGRLLADDCGRPVLASLAEKLLVPLLAKLTNLVPGGGIWLNTQRPEWNDANNALAGWGLSVVTTCYLRRYLTWLGGLLAQVGNDAVRMSSLVADLVGSITSALGSVLAEASGRSERMAAIRRLGTAGEVYRSALYRNGLTGWKDVPVSALCDLVAAALPVVDTTIRSSLRQDGLYDSYNVLELDADGAHVRRLAPMLEGQVAVLSSGLLSADESLSVLRSLRASQLYRADQHSYLLYPDRQLPSYVEKNTLPADSVSVAPLLSDLVASGDVSLVTVDSAGGLHFCADLRHAGDVAERLDGLGRSENWRDAVVRDKNAILGIWERVFRHGEFTGRSGAFFMFEGLGSIYWHMVAKLLVAVQEQWQLARASQAPPDVVASLAEAYRDVRAGLGYRKAPEAYGAFPTDPYSHSPRHTGAQQPGMTGQVKEEILTRAGELGVQAVGGRIRFDPALLDDAEFCEDGGDFEYIDALGQAASWRMPRRSVGFTCCGTPVCYVRGPESRIRVERADGRAAAREGSGLTLAESAEVLTRSGEILRITVTVPDTPDGVR